MIIICNAEVPNNDKSATPPTPKDRTTNVKEKLDKKEPKMTSSEWKLKIKSTTKCKNPFDSKNKNNIAHKLNASMSFNNENKDEIEDEPISQFKIGIKVDPNAIKDNNIYATLPTLSVLKQNLQFAVSVDKLKEFKISADLNNQITASFGEHDNNKVIDLAIEILELLSVKNDIIKKITLTALYDESKGSTRIFANGCDLSIKIKIGSLDVIMAIKLTYDNNKLSKEITIQIDNAITITISLNKTWNLIKSFESIETTWNSLKSVEFLNNLNMIEEVGFTIDVMKQIEKLTSSASKIQECIVEPDQLKITEAIQQINISEDTKSNEAKLYAGGL